MVNPTALRVTRRQHLGRLANCDTHAVHHFHDSAVSIRQTEHNLESRTVRVSLDFRKLASQYLAVFCQTFA